MATALALVAIAFLRAGAVVAGDPEPAAPDWRSIDVLVADEDGRPVEGARVEAFSLRGEETFSGPRGEVASVLLDPQRKAVTPNFSTTTGPGGQARVEGLAFGRSVLLVSHAGFASRRADVTAPGTEGPVRVELLRGHALEGRVLLDDGLPLAGAMVVATRGTYGMADSQWDPWTRSDAEGRWRFDALHAGEVGIAAFPAGTWSPRLDAVRLPGVTRYDFVLEPLAPIEGTVREKATGDPLAGAVVDVDGFGDHARAVTDASGRWTLPHFDVTHTATITVTKAGFTVVRADDGTRDVVLERAEPQPPEPANTPVAGWVRGIVLDAWGHAVRGASIRREKGRPFTATDDDGKFVLPCASPTMPVRVWAVREEDDFVTGLATPAASADEAVPVVLRWPPMTTFRVAGILRAPTGMKLVRPRVGERGLFGLHAWKSVAPDGRFELDVAEVRRDWFGLMATADGCVVTEVSKPASGVEIALSRGASLRGRARTEDGPAARATVWIQKADWQPARFDWPQNPTVYATTADDGSYAVDTLPAGAFDVYVGLRGTLATGGRVQFEDGASHEMDVVLPRPREIRGVLRWPDGSAVAGASVSASRHGRDRKSWGAGDGDHTTTDAQGRFVLRDLRPGTFDVTARPGRDRGASGAEFVETSIAGVVAGKDAVTIIAAPIVVRTGATLRALVVDERGAPVRGADVHAAPKDSEEHDRARTRIAVTAADGSFELKGLENAPYILTCRAPGLRTVQTNDVGADAKDLRVVLPDGLTIEGVLVDASGHPLADRTLRATLRDDRAPVPHRVTSAMSDAEGRFRFTGLDAGRTRIEVVGVAEPADTEFASPRYADAGSRDARIEVLAPTVLYAAVWESDSPYSVTRPLPGATVRVVFEGRTEPLLGVTDDDGIVQIGGVPRVRCTVYAELDGYEQFDPKTEFAGYMHEDVRMRRKDGK